VRVRVVEPFDVRRGAERRSTDVLATAEAELAPPMGLGQLDGTGDEYDGPARPTAGQADAPGRRHGL
jgi:hypothetical protein